MHLEKRLQILVVDNNMEDRKIATTLIKSLGHIAEEASSSIEAIEYIYRTPYDLVLMELCMPDIDGIKATKIIKTFPETRGHVNITALTLTTDPAAVKACLTAGMNYFLLKPLTLAQLNSVIRPLSKQLNQAGELP